MIRRRAASGVAFCALSAFAACEKNPARPDPGSLQVTVNAAGTDADERFSIQVNGGAAEAYVAGTPFVRPELDAGTYTVRISGISSNCTLQGGSQVQVTVTRGQRATATFNVACTMRWLAVTRTAFDATGSRIYRMNRDGTGAVALSPSPGTDGEPAISPDGTRIAFSTTRHGNAEIYVMNADGSNPVRLTTLPSQEVAPAWSPDGTRIAFLSQAYPEPSIVRVMNADGSGMTTVASGLEGAYSPMRWSPDGTRLALMMQLLTSADANIHTITVATGAVARVTPSPMPDRDPSWLEDGRLAYLRHGEDILAGVAVSDANGANRALLFDHVPHVEIDPAVSADGRWVAYVTPPPGGGWQELWVASVPGGTPVRIATGANHFLPVWQP